MDPRVLIGAVIGAVIMFFIAKNSPEWVQKFFLQQKENVTGVLAQTQKALDDANKKIQAMEIQKMIQDGIEAGIAKAKEVMK